MSRYYDSQVGSFISVDPLLSPGVPAQFNAYVYSGNNPVTWADPSGLFWGNLWSGIQAAAKKISNAVTSAWNATVSFVNTYKAEIAGVIVGLAVGIGCTVATGGVGVVACAIAGGAAGAAVTNVIKQAESGKPFDVGSFLFDTAVGGALGAVGGAAGPLLSSAIRSITTSGAGAAAVSAVRTGMQNVFNRMPSFRPSPAPVRPAVAPGGGARPAGDPSEGVSVHLQYKPGWSAAQREAADAKVSTLNEAAEAGSLRVSEVNRTGSSASRRFTADGNDIPQGADVDHIIDLQLGGVDDVVNMAPLDASVNRSLGAQIAAQIRGTPVGTCIIAVTICG